jgi:hypothetical protein
MKRQIFFGTMLSAALAVGVSAQQTPPSSASTPGQSDRTAQTVTVTGCLQSGSGASGSTASSPAGAPAGAPAGQAGATSSSSGQYILANATTGSGSSATGTTGATPPAGASSSSASTGKSYKLVGGDSEDLKKYVNSKVEVTGTLDSKSSSSGAGSTGTTGSAGASSSSMAGSMPTLKVTSVRQVSGSCTGGENR